MAYTIKSIAYPADKPILTIEADSLDDIAGLTGMAEGSTCKVDDTTYVYDAVSGWTVEGGGGSASLVFPQFSHSGADWTCDMTFEEVYAAVNGHTCVGAFSQGGGYYSLGGISTTEGHESVFFQATYIDTDAEDNPVVYDDMLIYTADGVEGYTYQFPAENSGGGGGDT